LSGSIGNGLNDNCNRDRSCLFMVWSIYIIRCGDNSLYTGISNDVSKRFEIHRSGSAGAAKYTRTRHPLQLVFTSEIGDRSAASRAEYRLKKLSKRSKELLIAGKTSLFSLGIIEINLD
jgi:putative endonuclease